MAQVARGVDPVAHALLERLDVGEAAVAHAIPERLAVAGDVEHAAGAGDQRHLGQILGEGGEQLLRQPGGAQEPAALAAVGDGDAGRVGSGTGGGPGACPRPRSGPGQLFWLARARIMKVS